LILAPSEGSRLERLTAGGGRRIVPITRSPPAAIPQRRRTTDRTLRTPITRPNPHAPHRRRDAHLRDARSGPRPRRLHSHADLPIMRPDPHAPRPRPQTDLPVERQGPRPSHRCSQPDLPIMRHDAHPRHSPSHRSSWVRFHGFLGSFSRFPGFVFTVSWVRFHDFGALNRPAGFVRSLPQCRSPSLPSDRTG